MPQRFILIVTAFLASLLTGADLVTIGPDRPVVRDLGAIDPSETYRLVVALRSGSLSPSDRYLFTLEGPGGNNLAKLLHAGDPDLTIAYRPTEPGPARVSIVAEAGSTEVPVLIGWGRMELGPEATDAIEAEPNDEPANANPLIIGRAIYGSGDDVDYLDNPAEGRSGLDWFRLEIGPETPTRLVTFELDLLDRDVACDLKLYVLDESGNTRPFEVGKDPTETIHDREPARYSKSITRVLGPGTYYLRVNANHPDYTLRTRAVPVPPVEDPQLAARIGLDYLLDAGDAWLAQIPRAGNIYRRSSTLHDTAERCTACHVTVYPTEAALAAHRAGYPIREKVQFQYLIDRLANAATPLYGTDGLYWQRYIAIPLQSQGKCGGVLLDYERQVAGGSIAGTDRYLPFLKAAWLDRDTLPPDEMNGVVPLDSKFSLAWRDFDVLRSFARRGDGEAHRAAANLAQLVAEPAADHAVETLQDRIHRLYALWKIDPETHGGRVLDEAEAILALQNPDGGFHEVDTSTGPSAIYTTGQIAWTLLEVGYGRDDPRIALALEYLKSRQAPFGGWFQEGTHENFRTPMRETRYATMALATAYPAGPPLTGWGNREPGLVTIPEDSGLVATLDALDDIWDVPESNKSALARQVIDLLDHEEPLIRMRAASLLGRLGRTEAAGPLARCLDDPSKGVVQAAAWALRRLGNAGLGVDTIAEAIRSPDPLMRRGATRIFAHQFQGLDENSGLAGLMLLLTDDPDLWTRLQAIRSLGQWFYRTSSNSLRRRIIYSYLHRMDAESDPTVRRALSEGLYLMLDENLGGGVSLSNTLKSLPAPIRTRVLAARVEVERDVLLGPILNALADAGPEQRDGILAAFDGSFLPGRGYARRPGNAIDVGNDREFGFLTEPSSDLLDRGFEATLTALPELEPLQRVEAIQLAEFFHVPGRTGSLAAWNALLDALNDPSAEVREAARSAVAELSMRGVGEDPDRLKTLIARLQGPRESADPLFRTLAGVPELIDRSELSAALMKRLDEPDGAIAMAPALTHPAFSDYQVAQAIARDWKRATEVADRLILLDALLARPALYDRPRPTRSVASTIGAAAADPSSTVRQRLINAVAGSIGLRNGPFGPRLLTDALRDPAPAVRRIALDALDKPGSWDRPDAIEILHALLADSDLGVRSRALTAVESMEIEPLPISLARRLHTLESDPALGDRARLALLSAGIDPGTLDPEPTSSPRSLPKFSTFRDRINPLLTGPGPDGVACAGCHANQARFRLIGGDQSDLSSIAANYDAAIRVADRARPESSLLLRKPTSPPGQGGPDPDSPTGLTHGGGPRWGGVDDPAYQMVLTWLSESRAEPLMSANADAFRPPAASQTWRSTETRPVSGPPNPKAPAPGSPTISRSTSASSVRPIRSSTDPRLRTIPLRSGAMKSGSRPTGLRGPAPRPPATGPNRDRSRSPLGP